MRVSKEVGLKIETLLLVELIPYARNPRRHPPAQVSQIAASIREFGFIVPVLVDANNGIIAGHGRVLAAEKLGILEVPCLRAAHLTETQKRAFVLADNKLTENAGWDVELLGLEFEDLKLADFDLELTGFSDVEVAKLINPNGGGEDPPAPDLPAKTAIRLGDVWHLGAHRLLCGDATDPTQVGSILGEAKPFLMVTDPPYGVEYDPAWRINSPSVTNTKDGDTRRGNVKNDDRFNWSDAFIHFPGNVAYIWHAALLGGDLHHALKSIKFEPRSEIIWRKNNFPVSRGHYHWQHEKSIYAVRKGQGARWCGDRTQTTIWDIAAVFGKNKEGEDQATGHGTQKPVECMARPMRNHGERGDAVYDPFVGSGTSIIAAETTGRECFAVDIDPGYCDVSIRRWQEFTGQKATRAVDGVPFDECGP